MDALSPFFGGILAVLLLTAFVKILTVLNILRFGMSLQGAGFGLVVMVLSLALTLVVSEPQLKTFGGVEGLLAGKVSVNQEALEQTFTPFLTKHSDPQVLSHFKEASKPSFSLLIASFLVSELKEAFYLGFLFIIPFVVLDLIVANVVMTLGMQSISTTLIALPLKILLFFAVDGWNLVCGKLLDGYL